MKDFIARVLIGSIVSAVISAGLLYFAFDQSLRGVETAVAVLDTSISGNGEWIRENKRSIETIGTEISGRLDTISVQLHSNHTLFDIKFNESSSQKAAIINAVNASLTTTWDAIDVIRSGEAALSQADKERLNALLIRLEAQTQTLGEMGVGSFR